jgi:hypothetical protein
MYERIGLRQKETKLPGRVAPAGKLVTHQPTLVRVVHLDPVPVGFLDGTDL